MGRGFESYRNHQCGYRIRAITLAFQANDDGSNPSTRSKERKMIWFLFFVAFDGATPDFMMYPKSFDTIEACQEHRQGIVDELGDTTEKQYNLICVSKKSDSV